jgi:hypothetical protein
MPSTLTGLFLSLSLLEDKLRNSGMNLGFRTKNPGFKTWHCVTLGKAFKSENSDFLIFKMGRIVSSPRIALMIEQENADIAK